MISSNTDQVNSIHQRLNQSFRENGIQMRFSNNVLRILTITFLLCSTNSFAAAYDGPDIGEPKYNVTDRNHVNAVSEQIYYSIEDVGIGSGNLSLTHSITINANDALNYESATPGYKDKFQGGIRRILYSQDENLQNKFEVISVYDHVGSYQFIITSSGTFEGLGDDVTKLTRLDANHYQLLKGDGTKVKFYTPGTIPTSIPLNFYPQAYMKEIIRPDGFKITIHKSSPYINEPVKSVTTNNGLQLKYIYDVHSRPLEPAKQNVSIDNNISANSVNWSSYHPTEVIALNNAVETCPLLSNTCTVTHDWPTAKYSWPDGMPRAFYIGESLFSVEDAEGNITKFHHKALSRGLRYGDSGTLLWPASADVYYPRIVKIETPSGQEITYKYRNFAQFNLVGITHFTYADMLGHGTLIEATNGGATTGYHFGPSRNEYQAQGSKKMVSSSYGDVYRGVHKVVDTYVQVAIGKIITTPFIIETWDKEIKLTQDFYGRVESIKNKLNNVTTYYTYDSLGRLIETDTDGIITKIGYKYTYCSGGTCYCPSFCSVPVSVSTKHNSFLGYNPEYTTMQLAGSTGQVEKATSPVVYIDGAGNKAPVQQFTYQNYYARYKNSSGTLVNSSVAISLPSEKRTCTQSSFSGTNCAGGDKVTTTYHYGTGSPGNNLFLIGQTISAQGESESFTTCYKYNKYGHMIGETLPESGVTDCNIGRAY